MDELPRHAKTLLRDAGLAHEPPAGAQERVRERIRLLEQGAAEAARVSWHARHLRKLLAAGGAATIVVASVWLGARTSEPAPTAEHTRVESRLPAPPPKPVDVPAPAVDDTAVVVRPQRAERGRAPESGEGANLVAELRVLTAASLALQDADLARARKQLDTYRRRFPRGQLRSEHDGLEVLYGCQSKATASAGRARAYLASVPGGLLVSRIESACELNTKP